MLNEVLWLAFLLGYFIDIENTDTKNHILKCATMVKAFDFDMDFEPRPKL
jgi:hypothetical protein